jgi:hypothetical protein
MLTQTRLTDWAIRVLAALVVFAAYHAATGQWLP